MGTLSGCTACDSGKGCGAGVFAKLLQKKPVTLELARQSVRVEPGQMVTLAFPEHVYLSLVLGYYGWPLLAALGGAIVGYRLGLWLQFDPMLLDAATLGVGVATGFLTLRVIKQRKSMHSVLNSLRTTVYYPSATPNMCSNTFKKS